MGITYDAVERIFHLETTCTSYAMKLIGDGILTHVYWGRKVRGTSLSRLPDYRGRAFSPDIPYQESWVGTLDTIQMEYPAYGNGDFREPAFQVQQHDGSTVSSLRYTTHRIMAGKPQIPGLPATYVEAEDEASTLEIDMVDNLTGLKVTLSYSAFEDIDVICRWTRFENCGDHAVTLQRALSSSVDLPDSEYDLLQLSGAWARERHIHRCPLSPGVQGVGSRRGASSHQQNPFIALAAHGADEDSGNVYGFSLVYSGNFIAQAEVDQYSTTRISVGINPFDFAWCLEPGSVFNTPEVVMVYSSNGLGQMSRTYHRLYRQRLCRSIFRDVPRPILINNWEATYFNFDADKIESIARVGRELGIELMVLDDGWFGKRDDDRSSLGDWKVDERKLPRGLNDLAARVTGLGMQFGLWFEPEMVSPDSHLYRAHPDWCLHVQGRHRTEARQQLILDLSRQDVRDYIVSSVSDILSSAPITYVKWDMNRHMTEVGSALLPPDRQRETAHRYMLGLYDVMERITSAFPEVLFESCSGGGGRFDPGILHYMPQTWTSDDTDAIERLMIQYGTSMVYPISAMGSHVSACPNHQLGRNTSLETRGNVAMSGNFGYELDLTKFTDAEMDVVRAQVALYKEVRALVQRGDFFRLASPFDGNEAAWMFVSEDKNEALVFYARILAVPNAPLRRLRLKGLDPKRDYHVVETGAVYGGDELMYAGFKAPDFHGDFASRMWRFTAV